MISGRKEEKTSPTVNRNNHVMFYYITSAFETTSLLQAEGKDSSFTAETQLMACTLQQ